MTQAKSVNREFWGVDGCAAGWMVARRAQPEGVVEFSIFPSWDMLLATLQGQDPLIAVDMPIGLPDVGRRSCDVLARRQLGHPRGSSVFAAPRRPMLLFETYEQANSWGKAQGSDGGGGLSKQAWNLIPKIRQIDNWIDSQKQNHVKEAHPELAFQRLNGGVCPPPKHSTEGQIARIELLARQGITAPEALRNVPQSAAKIDDILDAAVLAWTAETISQGTATCLTGEPERDACGLKMEIWF